MTRRLGTTTPTAEDERATAEAKAWDALARYKFWMFGYWCATWVHMNRLCSRKAKNPWHELVTIARRRSGQQGSTHRHDRQHRRPQHQPNVGK